MRRRPRVTSSTIRFRDEPQRWKYGIDGYPASTDHKIQNTEFTSIGIEIYAAHHPHIIPEFYPEEKSTPGQSLLELFLVAEIEMLVINITRNSL